jgi:hypothetical protein
VVAGLAEPLAVLLAGFTVLGRAFGVVVVSDRGVAPGGAAELVAQSDQGAESVGEAAGPCVGCDQRPGLGPHVQSLELRQSLFRGGLDERWKPPTGGDDSALGVVDFSIFPHLGMPPENLMADAEVWAAGLPGPAYAIDDDTAIKVTDGTVDVISEGTWRHFPHERRALPTIPSRRGSATSTSSPRAREGKGARQRAAEDQAGLTFRIE